MKIILILLVIILCCKQSYSQNSDSSSLPYAQLTEKQFKIKNILSKVGNYDEAIGQPFSSFSLTSIDGKKISTQHLIGKVTFINFWFDACAPCHLEFEYLNSLFILNITFMKKSVSTKLKGSHIFKFFHIFGIFYFFNIL